MLQMIKNIEETKGKNGMNVLNAVKRLGVNLLLTV